MATPTKNTEEYTIPLVEGKEEEKGSTTTTVIHEHVRTIHHSKACRIIGIVVLCFLVFGLVFDDCDHERYDEDHHHHMRHHHHHHHHHGFGSHHKHGEEPPRPALMLGGDDHGPDGVDRAPGRVGGPRHHHPHHHHPHHHGGHNHDHHFKHKMKNWWHKHHPKSDSSSLSSSDDQHFKTKAKNWWHKHHPKPSSSSSDDANERSGDKPSSVRDWEGKATLSAYNEPHGKGYDKMMDEEEESTWAAHKDNGFGVAPEEEMKILAATERLEVRDHDGSN
eukprot:CAMPEP_0116840964 /NCGR_PEP_ID=MMETSP0418-20121206/10657_1 /TAXON_ID=1158023 /ORGANISM="Astrosyne radiata, Strain 13vi08-1A" /LENGTH=276 /DNA_ID=CAMNT_0004471329 /DNA_START=131 /DNA_END=961 /DNA_ORIENTATION=-